MVVLCYNEKVGVSSFLKMYEKEVQSAYYMNNATAGGNIFWDGGAGYGSHTKPTNTRSNTFLRANHPGELNAHFNEAINYSEFFSLYSNMSYSEILNQEDRSGVYDSKVGGPTERWLIDPLYPDVVIDVKHFFRAMTSNRVFGNINEMYQAFKSNPSAHNPQDYYSNNLGFGFKQYFQDMTNSINFGNKPLFFNYLKIFLTNPTIRSKYIK